ncbi:MAG: MIP/aquaporin family protein [Thermoplasmata archaeon]
MNFPLWKRCLAEVAGTALLVGIGTGAVVFFARGGGSPQWELAVAWFFAVLVPIVLFIEVSGAHLNPVVTLGLAVSGRIAWAESPVYFLGQFAGAFLGSVVVERSIGTNAHLGSTVPSTALVVAFGVEAAFTAALLCGVFLLADRGEGRFRWRLALPPLVVGISTYLIGPLTGSSLNPARTIAPAVLSGTYTDLWLYLIAVPLGALLVAMLWRPRAVDRLDRGPGRVEITT